MATLGEHIRQSTAYKWWILGMIMLGTFMAVLDVTVVNVGLPAIMSAFGIGISTAEWVITAYMITMTVMLPSAGWFADRFGNKRIYILGLALFTLGSWLCGKAPGDLFLIWARALQGVGSGIIQSLGLAIVTREFRPEERGLALGLWAMAAAASISFGPLLGGYLVDAYSWHRIFDVNVPVGVLAILLSAFIQKEWKSPARHPFDWRGFVAIALFMPLAIFALARGNSPTNHDGWASPTVIGCFAVAAVALAYFVRTELRSPAPLLQLRLLGERNFGVSMAVLTLFSIGMLGGTYLLPLYMPARAGLHGADGRERIPARGAHTRGAVGRIGLPHALRQAPAAHGGGHPAAGAELLAGQPVSRSTPPTGIFSSCSISAGWAWGSRSPR